MKCILNDFHIALEFIYRLGHWTNGHYESRFMNLWVNNKKNDIMSSQKRRQTNLLLLTTWVAAPSTGTSKSFN